MECIFPLALILGFVIWGFIYLINQLQHIREEAAVYKDNIPASRVKLMTEVFGISGDELRFMHFDGISFDFHGRPTYKDFTSVRLVRTSDVHVVNSKLPHTGYWQHERVDGGPDRRYRSNSFIMTSRRYQLSFRGAKQHTLTTYEGPTYYDEIQTTLGKFNIFLAAAQSINLELAIEDYDASNRRIKSLQSVLQRLVAERLQLEQAIAAAKRLHSYGTVAVDKSVDTESMTSQKWQLDSTIAAHQMQIDQEIQNCETIVRELKNLVDRQKDLQIVQPYMMSNK